MGQTLHCETHLSEGQNELERAVVRAVHAILHTLQYTRSLASGHIVVKLRLRVIIQNVVACVTEEYTYI